MSSPLLTVLMELHTSTSWPELITCENHPSLTVWRSPRTMVGLTLSGIQTPLPMILPSLSFHPQLTSTTTLLHPVCPWLETPLMRLNLSQLQDGESPQTTLAESPPSSGWSQISPASLTRSATTSMELSETESSALTPPEERDLATEILVPPGHEGWYEGCRTGMEPGRNCLLRFLSGCEVGYPAGFTRTEYYLDWIKSETGM